MLIKVLYCIAKFAVLKALCDLQKRTHLFSESQLFDEDNPLHKSDSKYIFTTEGHVVPIDKRFREKQWSDVFPCEDGVLMEREEAEEQQQQSNFTNVRPRVVLSLEIAFRYFGSHLWLSLNSAAGSRWSDASPCR